MLKEEKRHLPFPNVCLGDDGDVGGTMSTGGIPHLVRLDLEGSPAPTIICLALLDARLPSIGR